MDFDCKNLKKARLPKIGAFAIAQTDQHKMLDYMKAYIPRPLQLSMDSGARSAVGTTRLLTTLFIMMPDIGVWREKTQTPSDYLELAQKRFSAVQMASSYYEATVRQFIVDDKGAVAIIIVGLPPFYHADNASRGVDIALAIKTAIANSKIGISSGTVYSGIVGSDIRCEYSAVGDKVNMAARLMCKAEEGNILVDANTHEKTKNLFSTLELDPIEIKGKTKPVTIYKILGKEFRKVTDRSHASALTGRAFELKKTKVGLTGGPSGAPCLATIYTGGRGVGKTAMLDQYTLMVRDHMAETWGGKRFTGNAQTCKKPMRKASIAGSVVSTADETGSLPFVVLYISAELSETEIGPWAVFIETLLTVSQSSYKNDVGSRSPKGTSRSEGAGSASPRYSTMNVALSPVQGKGPPRHRSLKGSLNGEQAHCSEEKIRNKNNGPGNKSDRAPQTPNESHLPNQVPPSLQSTGLAKMVLVRNASFANMKKGAEAPMNRRSSEFSTADSVHEFCDDEMTTLSPDYIDFARRQSIQELVEEKNRRAVDSCGNDNALENQAQTIGEFIVNARGARESSTRQLLLKISQCYFHY